MLSKCANPACSNTFRYLHEGRLYLIGPREALTGHKSRCLSPSGQLEYGWLCSSCSLYLTIQIDEECGMRVMRKLDVKNGFGFGTSAKDGRNNNSRINDIRINDGRMTGSPIGDGRIDRRINDRRINDSRNKNVA